MNDVQDVAALTSGRFEDGIPLSDWGVSRVLNCCSRFGCESSCWPSSIRDDPSLASWLSERVPPGATVNDVVACMDGIAQLNPVEFFSASIVTARMSGVQWQGFQRWWRREATTTRLAQEALKSVEPRVRSVIPILCGLLSGPPWWPHDTRSRSIDFVTTCDRDREIADAIDQARRRVLEDPQLADELTTEQPCQVGAGLRPLHDALPGLLHTLAEARILSNAFGERLEQEKLQAMKELAYGASHEINNPLANISSRAQVLLREESDPQRRRSLATINSQAFRAHEMIADMMLFAKPPALELKELKAQQFVDSVVDEITRELPPSIEFVRADAESIPDNLHADPIQLTVALQAICANAVEAMEGQGRLVIRLGQAALDWTPAGPMAEIEIQDDGPGIPPEVRKHLFDPFYSGREAGRGLGFGLSKAWRIVQMHGGQIHVHSEAREGATFTLYVPTCSASALSDSDSDRGSG